ncbi:Clp protease N-terminal domain-containing protein [Nocardioides limicola]
MQAESPGRALLLQAGVDTDALRKELEEQTRGVQGHRALPSS